MTSKKSNYKFLLKGTLTTAGTTVVISNDLELDQEVTFTNASVVLRNRTGSVIERTKATATGGVLTFLKRGLEQGDMEVEDSDLKKERRDGTVGYVTMLAPQLLDRLEYTEFYNGITGGDYADAAARDAALGGDGVALHPYVGVFVQDEGVHYNYNTSTGQWEAVETGTVTPNASPTVAGRVQLATDQQVTDGDNDGSSGPLVVQPSQLLHEIDVSSFDEVTPADTDEMRVNRAGDKKKISYTNISQGLHYGAYDFFRTKHTSLGNVTISTNTTLNSDRVYDNLTIDAGVILNTGGYRIRVKGTLTNNGTIQRNGNVGNNGIDGSGFPSGNGGAGATGLSAGTLAGSTAGGNGGGPSLAASATNKGDAQAGAGGNGGAGSLGGGSSSSDINPGLGGTSTVRGVVFGPTEYDSPYTGSTSGPGTEQNFYFDATAIGSITGVSMNTGGSGGGGGMGKTKASGGPRASGGGGGGGSAGGIIYIASTTLVNNGTISANGGNGGNGGNGSGDQGGGGGGGGGGAGGVIVLLYRTATIGTVTATGGTGGLGGTLVEPGANGQNGGAGRIFRIKL